MSTDYYIKMNTKEAFIMPKNIQYGYLQGKRMFAGGPVDNVTQVFQDSHSMILSRTDFQLYIGYITPLDEIDIIGTILNSTNIPTQKFIYYCSSDVFGDFTGFPAGIYKTDSNGITNIAKLTEGVNISNDYILTMSFKNASTTSTFDIVNPHGTQLQLKTLRNNQVVTKSAMLGSHAGDMKSSGAFIPDAEFLLPTNFNVDGKVLVISALEVSPSAVWNTARNLVVGKKVTNWVMIVSILPSFSLGSFDGFSVLDYDNKMKVIYYTDSGFTITLPTVSELVIAKDASKILLVSQKYITSDIRSQYLSVATLYPGPVPTTMPEYQQYKYNAVKKISYIDYNTSDLEFVMNETFIGGVQNNINLYANVVKAAAPTVQIDRLSSATGMYVDYFPSVKNANDMNAYLTIFEDIMQRGSNNKILKYTCLMRVRKEWIKTKAPNETYFQVIEDANVDYALIFLFGGTDTRYQYTAANKTFTLDKYQSIIFDTEKAKSAVPSERDIYLENQLDAVLKPSDAVRYINLPLNMSTYMQSAPITTYGSRDFISFFVVPYNASNGIGTINGNVTQSDISYSRLSYIQDSWFYFIYFISTMRQTTENSQANCIIFFNITDLVQYNIEILSLKASIEKYIKEPKNSQYANFSVMYDSTNKLFTVSNIDVAVGPNADYYSFLYDKMYIKSVFRPSPPPEYIEYLLLDVPQNKFTFTESKGVYSNVSLSMKTDPTSSAITYSQVERASRRTTGVQVTGDNPFWSSVRAFAFIDDLSKFEVNNLVDMTKYISMNLEGFYIVSLVSYDTTSSDTWKMDRCVIVRGNSTDSVSIKYNDATKKFYYVSVHDNIYPSNYMKFGVWNSTTPMENSDLADIDFMINKSKGIDYDTKYKVNTNERVQINTGYFNFTLPNDTQNSFPKFLQFTSQLNKYILFARPVDKGLATSEYQNGVCVLEITLTSSASEFDFSEVINFVVQWRTLTKNGMRRIIIYTKQKAIKKPDKEHKLVIDEIVYNTSDFTFMDNNKVIIYPSVEYDSVGGVWDLGNNVFYKDDVVLTPPIDSVYYTGPGPSGNLKLGATVGSDSGYSIKPSISMNHLNMQMSVHDIVVKK